MKGYVREAQYCDIPLLVADLRPSDLAEIKAASRIPVDETLKFGIDEGLCEVACLPNGVPTAIWGVVPTVFNPDLGLIWMVATDQFKHLHRQFLRECREGVERIGRGYKAVFNYTDARNTVHHRWLKWSGFTIIKEHPNFGVEGRPFYEFVRPMERHHV